MYTKKQFGKELKEKIIKKEPIIKIGEWAHTMYIKHILDINSDFRALLLDLNTLELGPEFEHSYEELLDIANRLITGEDVRLY